MDKTLQITLANILGGADAFIRDYGDEDVFEPWLMGGIPDGADEDEVYEIASSISETADILECFCRRLRQIQQIESIEEMKRAYEE